MKIVAIEGINASGKTTLAASLQRAFNDAGVECNVVDAASYGDFGRAVRHCLIDVSLQSTPALDATLFAALRAEGALKISQERESRPNTFIVIERWILSLAAYGKADGANPTLVESLGRMLREILPDVQTVLLDVRGHTACSRLGPEAMANRFERRGAGYLQRVAEAYREAAASRNDVIVIDANGTAEQTFESVWRLVGPVLK